MTMREPMVSQGTDLVPRGIQVMRDHKDLRETVDLLEETVLLEEMVETGLEDRLENKELEGRLVILVCRVSQDSRVYLVEPVPQASRDRRVRVERTVSLVKMVHVRVHAVLSRITLVPVIPMYW